MTVFQLGGRPVGPDEPPLVIAEIGINHEGNIDKAIRMIDDAADAGCECVKFQCHVIEDEMIPNDVVPGNADESIWDIMDRCKLTLDEDIRLRDYSRDKGMIYLSTPFSRAAADQLEGMGVPAYKIGSGECNNYPLIKHIAGFGKPIILSTGMNDIASIRPSWEIIKNAGIPCVLMHCTSLYPTPYESVRLGALDELRDAFDTDLVGLSDHSLGNYSCFGAAALGASVLERHFTSDKSWPGPDIPISMDPAELADLIKGSRAIFAARGGSKAILDAEQPTIDFAYATVVTIRDIAAGETLDETNVWVKRPGTGEIKAEHYDEVLGRTARQAIAADQHVSWKDLT